MITCCTRLAIVALVTTLIPLGPVKADTIAAWTFETSIPATAGPFTAEVGSGSASGYHAGAAVYSSPAGNGSSHSFSSNTWAIGDYYQFQVSTTGLSGIQLDWDQTSSNTGPRDFRLAYSTDLLTFTDINAYNVLANAAPNPVWNGTTSSSIYHFTSNLSSNTALDNMSNVYFRLIDNSTTSANNGTVAAAGTDRVDNFTVSVVPEPSSIMLLVIVAFLGFVSSQWRRK